MANTALPDDMLTIVPLPRGIMWRAAAWLATKAERSANLHAIGFNSPYETQTLALVNDQPVVSPNPSERGTPNSDSPIWVVSAPKTIVNGHDGFLYPHPSKQDPGTPYLADWLMQLYAKDCAAAPEMRGCQGNGK